MTNSSIWSIERTQSRVTNPGQSWPGSDGNERKRHILSSSSITEASPWDCLVTYWGQSLRGVGWGLTTLQICRQCILQPQPTYEVFSLYIYIFKYRDIPVLNFNIPFRYNHPSLHNAVKRWLGISFRLFDNLWLFDYMGLCVIIWLYGIMCDYVIICDYAIMYDYMWLCDYLWLYVIIRDYVIMDVYVFICDYGGLYVITWPSG